MIIPHERMISTIKEGGVPSERFAAWIEEVTRAVNLNTPITGSGSPEGVITASPTQRYMDTAGGAGTILYIKQTGTGNTGWILV